MKTRNPSYDRTGAGGQTLVEFALILFLLLAMLFGITEFGRAWYYSNALTNGVRAGARYAATIDNNTSFENKVRNYTMGQITSVIPRDNLSVDVVPMNSAAPPVVISSDELATGDTVTVFANYSFVVLTGSIVPAFSGTKGMRRQATMRYE